MGNDEGMDDNNQEEMDNNEEGRDGDDGAWTMKIITQARSWLCEVGWLLSPLWLG